MADIVMEGDLKPSLRPVLCQGRFQLAIGVAKLSFDVFRKRRLPQQPARSETICREDQAVSFLLGLGPVEVERSFAPGMLFVGFGLGQRL